MKKSHIAIRLLISTMTVFVLSLTFFSSAVIGAPENITIQGPLSGSGGPSTIEDSLAAFFGKIQELFAITAIITIAIAGILYISAGANSQLAETAKKTVTGAIIGLVLFLGIPTFLKEIKGLLGGFSTDPTTALSFSEIASNFLNTILSITGVLAIISTVISGILYLSAMGAPQKSESAKKAFQFSIIGVIITLSGLIIVRQIAALFQ